MSHKTNPLVFDQSCSQYLKYLGIEAEDGDLMDCPYRRGSDSGAFSINGPLWHDFPTGAGGNVWQLALRMHNGDQRKALESLYRAAGEPFVPDQRIQKTLSDRDKALAALEKVRTAFAIDAANTPASVITYLEGRKVGEKSRPFFSFIPQGKLASVLSDEEIDLTGLRHREGLIILWYLKGGKPVYYCTRDIQTKAFKKASLDNGVLEHPIWNGDALYRDANVVWGEGMFDCASLLELGYGVAGEITCNLHDSHREQLLMALRWRLKHHPDWTFTICLDNDELTNSGRRPGNEAAEKMAIWLWGNGVDVKWAKHAPSDKKIDINMLHQGGMENPIRQMIDGAKQVSAILNTDEDTCLRNFIRMTTHCDFKGATRILGIIKSQKPDATLPQIIERTQHLLWDWREIYRPEVKDIFVFGSDVYVIFGKDAFGKGEPHYQVFAKGDFIKNMETFQINPEQDIKFTNLNIQFQRVTWKVARPNDHEAIRASQSHTYNLFCPSPLLLQPAQAGAALPEVWDRLLDNLAGPVEKRWLLNHLAVYVQTLEKPRTIPVIVGAQGTGKTVLATLLGEGIGGYVGVGNAEVESDFNQYLMTAVVLLDELATSQRDSVHLKNKLKSFINERQTINMKHRQPITACLNNYIIVASNEHVTHVPLVIEKNDRRYTIIAGGKDRNLANEPWFKYEELTAELPNFMLHLLSRDISTEEASSPLASAKKTEFTEQGEDLRVQYFREYLEGYRKGIYAPETVCLTTICHAVYEAYHMQTKLTSRTARPIVEHLEYKVIKHHNQAAIVLEPFGPADPGGPADPADPTNPPKSPNSPQSDGSGNWGDNAGELASETPPVTPSDPFEGSELTDLSDLPSESDVFEGEFV